jgi:aminomethyltransferase
MPRFSPFYSRTSALCESHSWLEWSGFLAANMYELHHLREYWAIRTAAGLIDISPLYKYHIQGRDALKLLNRVVTRDLSKCAIGQVIYTPWCDEHGKIIDDGTIAHLAEDFYRLTAADPTLRWLSDNALGLDVQIEEVTESIAALALQGPLSKTILDSISNPLISNLPYHRLMPTTIAGASVTVSRTGYTGDLGYELWLAPSDAEKVWDALMSAGQPLKLRAAGQLALDMARIEAGLLLVATDFVSSKKTIFEIQKSTPYELGLGWAIKFDKGNFVGRDALLKEKESGPKWATVGLEVEWESLEAIYRSFGMPIHLPESAWSVAVPVYANGQHIGKATSGTWSPLLKKYVVLARLHPHYAQPGTVVSMEVTVEAHRRLTTATVVKLPFFDPVRKKSSA